MTNPNQINTSNASPKPYELVSLSRVSPIRKHPAGHDRLRTDRLHGRISLRLTVQTSSFIASGVVAMGSDLSSQIRNIPLIKLAIESNNQLVIPGSSLKGTVRSTYEAITRSCLCKTKAKKEQIPEYYRECDNLKQLCRSCQVFGAMGWQGLVSFEDALLAEKPEEKITTGFMPSLYSPSSERSGYYQDGKVAGRKFYYHAKQAVEKTESQGIPVQNLTQNSTFTTQIRFRNLKQAELGILFTVLGQDKTYPFALKIGGGKPVGMGSLTTEILEIDCPDNVRDRCLSYNTSSEALTGNEVNEFMEKAIKTAHQTKLIQPQQLQELQQILAYPTDREAPSGMY
jgi:CRISPR/Cas system CSM-associated protein Csm3 (group 7 of RAMP superfamily)